MIGNIHSSVSQGVPEKSQDLPHLLSAADRQPLAWRPRVALPLEPSQPPPAVLQCHSQVTWDENSPLFMRFKQQSWEYDGNFFLGCRKTCFKPSFMWYDFMGYSYPTTIFWNPYLGHNKKSPSEWIDDHQLVGDQQGCKKWPQIRSGFL